MYAQYYPILIMLRLMQVVERTGLSRSTIYNMLNPDSEQYDPRFPKQVRVGSGAVRWIESEINAWLEECVKSSRG